MNIIDVKLKENSYKIIIGKNNLSGLGTRLKPYKIGADAIIITNPVINKLHGAQLVKGLKKSGFSVKVFEVPDGEKSKSMRVAFRLMEQIARYDIMKKPFIVAFGGGVIGDLAGYVAAAYKRGIPYIQVPTSFLAQIDSAIGGKVAIDLPVGKNLVGAFYQPKMVYSDVAVLSTLTKRQIRNGLAEAVKYGIIDDSKLFDFIAAHVKPLVEADLDALKHIVYISSRIKAKVVTADEKDTKGVRAILNFGHTIGHAIEAAGGFKIYQHGEAIALGMRVAADISCQLKLFSLNNVLKLNDLLTAIGLPQTIKKASLSDIMRLMKHDKKFISGKNRFVLACRMGTVKIREGIPESVIKKAIRKYR